jgi:hypothetical protein
MQRKINFFFHGFEEPNPNQSKLIKISESQISTYRASIIALIIIFLVGSSSENSLAQAIIDSTNSITMDNLTQESGYVLIGNDTIGYYQEFSSLGNTGWVTNSFAGYGGNYRRTPFGAINDAKVSLKVNIAKADTYLVYYYHNTGYATSRASIKFINPTDSSLIDSVSYNMLDNFVRSEFTNCWFLIGMLVANSGKPGIEIQLGRDTLNSAILVSDAVRLLRSNVSGADLEFGNRRFSNISYNFFRDRATIDFPYTIFNWNGYQDKKLMLYNIGSSTLNISNIQFHTDKFSVLESLPLMINPGSKKEITIRFSPTNEGIVNDSILIYSNDEKSPVEIMPLYGEGIAYNFVLNASLNGIEPHWNVPSNAAFYTSTSNWLSSTASPWPFPIAGGNLSSIVNTGSDPTIKAIYTFSLPDSMSGQYTLDYSGPAGSATAAQHATVDLVTPSYINPNPALGDTQRVTDVNLRAVQAPNPLWVRIGEQTIFQINGGGQTTICLTNPYQGADLLRVDLIRVKKYYPPSSVNSNSQPQIPEHFSLLQNFPNPFNPSTTIRYSLTEKGNVKIFVYDILGRKIAELVNEFKEAGLHNIDFNGKELPSGIYFYRITCNNFSSTRKMLLLR